MEKPQLTMSHHGLGEEGMKCIARSLAVSYFVSLEKNYELNKIIKDYFILVGNNFC